jgi:hypothetical protein
MNSDDTAIILQAFSLALSNLDVELPAPMRREIQQVGNAVERRNTEAAAEAVLHLVKQSDRLHHRYQSEYDHLNQQDSQRSKFLTQNGNGTAALSWRDPVAEILSADDFHAAAKQFLRRQHRQKSQNPEISAFAIALQKNIQTTEAHRLDLLQTLDQQILTVEDLAFAIDLPLEQALTLVQNLWQEGYIYPSQNSILNMFFPTPRKTKLEVSPGDCFSLTAKGYFHLHPFITTR